MNNCDTSTTNNPTPECFPAGSLIRFTLGERHYIGRSHRAERAHVVETTDAAGRSVSYSWPYICANASNIREVDEISDII